MAVSIYLSNNILRAVVGNPSTGLPGAKKEYRKVVPEGSLINGVITNQEVLKEDLLSFWNENHLPKKDVYLVVYSSKFVSKQLELPKVNKKKTEQILPLEFAEVDRYENPIYDYLIPPNKNGKNAMQEVIGVMADREMVAEYEELFSSIGITLKGITNGLTASIKAFYATKSLKEATCMIHVLDGANMESIIWVDGEYRHSSTRRLFTQRGTTEFVTEIMRHTNSTMQFYNSMKREEPLEDIYLCGFTQAEIDDADEMAREVLPGVRISSLKEGAGMSDQIINDFTHPLGGLVRMKKDIDFLARLRKDSVSVSEGEKRKKMLIPILISAALGILLTVAAGVFYFSQSAKLNELEEYVNDPNNQQTAKEYDELNRTLTGNNAVIGDGKKTEEMIASYPLLNTKIEKTILAANSGAVTGEITSYKGETGELLIVVEASNVAEINNYVTRLYNTELFVDVVYNGYDENKETDGYSAVISGYLKKEAGR